MSRTLVVNGEEVYLSEAVIDELHRQENIEWGKYILENYEEELGDRGRKLENIADDEFEEYVNKLEDRMLDDNGVLEQEVLEDVFGVVKGY